MSTIDIAEFDERIAKKSTRLARGTAGRRRRLDGMRRQRDGSPAACEDGSATRTRKIRQPMKAWKLT